MFTQMDAILGSLYAFYIADDTSPKLQSVYDGFKLQLIGGLYSKGDKDGDEKKLDFLSQHWQRIERGDCSGDAITSEHLYAPHFLTLENLLAEKRQMYHGLVQRFIRLQPSMQARIDAFVDEHFTSDLFFIGIHYRGNEKSGEALRTSYDDVLQALDAAAATNVDRKEVRFFVATDEGPFLAWMLERFPTQTLYPPDVCRSSENTGEKIGIQHIPHKNSAIYAIMDMYVLSKTSHLVRTESNLSRWSLIIVGNAIALVTLICVLCTLRRQISRYICNFTHFINNNKLFHDQYATLHTTEPAASYDSTVGASQTHALCVHCLGQGDHGSEPQTTE
jgi:hypothetical protein